MFEHTKTRYATGQTQIGTEDFGQNAKVIGALEGKTNTIDNARTERAPMAKTPGTTALSFSLLCSEYALP